MTVTVRRVDARDVPAVAALIGEVLAEFGLTFGAGSETDAQVLALPGSYDDHGGAFWVALDERGTLLGTVGVYPVEPRVYELRKMYLHAASRGRGVGRALFDVARAWAVAQGGARMVLDTTEQMTRAITFYESQGFVRDDAQIRGSRCSRGYSLALEPA